MKSSSSVSRVRSTCGMGVRRSTLMPSLATGDGEGAIGTFSTALSFGSSLESDNQSSWRSGADRKSMPLSMLLLRLSTPLFVLSVLAIDIGSIFGRIAGGFLERGRQERTRW